mgnify:CR=1 FL=1
MSLPVPNLDDRHFQDIVDEAKRLIPVYCPEWTNHNVSDPGVALIELFAWMTEMTLFRLNQVPDVFYTHMLNLLGFEPFPASAARTDLTFWLSGPAEEAIVVPEGIIFQSGTAYKALRKMLVDTSLVAVVSLPAGVFNPYSGVKTSIPLHQALMNEPDFIHGDYTIKWLEEWLAGRVSS